MAVVVVVVVVVVVGRGKRWHAHSLKRHKLARGRRVKSLQPIILLYINRVAPLNFKAPVQAERLVTPLVKHC